MLRITGNSRFDFSDVFEDPLDIGVELGSAPYTVTGNWRARFTAEIVEDSANINLSNAFPAKMKGVDRLIVKLSRFTGATLFIPFFILAVAATTHWAQQFRDSVVLPSGLILKRSFDFTRNGRNDLLSYNGKLKIARDVEFVCFNDRYIWVWSFRPEDTGLYDAETNARMNGVGYPEAMAISGLSDRNGCNGYYTSMLGPGLLYDGNEAPFLPRCRSRNLDNPSLARRDWFERPCEPDSR